jgi:ubiquinone/menaquinone biosynthesis C-methylase UbiE
MAMASMLAGTRRRRQRQRRRRLVGRAYDMALEVARVLPPLARVLDVGCGNGFIAHHLTAMLGEKVVGIDVTSLSDAPIEFMRYDGMQFPVADQSFDAVLLCYVLHHAKDFRVVLGEVRRVLRKGGLVIVYEDIPDLWWDRFICWTHDLQWRRRTGHCVFKRQPEWCRLFLSLGFEIVRARPLSRWRNLAHPVSRWFYVLRASEENKWELTVLTA